MRPQRQVFNVSTERAAELLGREEGEFWSSPDESEVAV